MKKILILLGLISCLMATENTSKLNLADKSAVTQNKKNSNFEQPKRPIGMDQEFFKKYKEHMIVTATQELKIIEEYKKCATIAQDKQTLRDCSTKKMEGMRTMHEKQRASMENSMNSTKSTSSKNITPVKK